MRAALIAFDRMAIKALQEIGRRTQAESIFTEPATEFTKRLSHLG
jgi:hypothetical protein